MTKKVIIFGKDTCPFTKAACNFYAEKNIDVEYINVVNNEDQLNNMLKYSNGSLRIPVIVEGESVKIGFKGKT
ncbi:Glutaredoxin [Candidatus Magnetomoraceae bacterium gMMP-15]